MDEIMAIKNLKDRVKKTYKKSKDTISHNIYRGYSEAMDVVIENEIALFLSNILPKNYEFYIDSSISIEEKKKKKTHRPDILVIDAQNKNLKYVKAMIEIKANMGHCRGKREIITKLKNKHKSFIKQKQLICSFPIAKNGIVIGSDKKEVLYRKSAKCFLVTFTSQNCSEHYHENITKESKRNNIPYFILFNQWYGNPSNRDIEKFANTIKKITK